MKVVVDKLLKRPVLHTHGGLLGTDIEFPVEGFIMNCGSKRYRVTIDCTGALVTTEIVVTTVGTPIGLLLALTYPA